MGKTYDGRKTDAWALGVVLYALLCRILPFAAPTHATPTPAPSSRRTYLMKIAKADFTWPLEAPLATETARQVVSSLLVRDPKRRALPADVFAMEWCQGAVTRKTGDEVFVHKDNAYVDSAVRAEA